MKKCVVASGCGHYTDSNISVGGETVTYAHCYGAQCPASHPHQREDSLQCMTCAEAFPSQAEFWNGRECVATCFHDIHYETDGQKTCVSRVDCGDYGNICETCVELTDGRFPFWDGARCISCSLAYSDEPYFNMRDNSCTGWCP